MMFALIVALHAMPAPDTAPPVHYHIVSKTTSDLDLSAMGQPPQSFVMTLSAYVTVTLADSAGGKTLYALVDSSTFDGGEAAQYLPPEMTASAKGTVYVAYLLRGKPVSPLAPSPMSVQGAQLGPALAILLSGLRASKAGDTWADSERTDTTLASTQATASGSRTMTWTVKAGDAGVLQLDGAGNGTTTVGSGQMQMDLKTNGTSHATARPGQLVETAVSTSGGQASMNLGGNAIPMKVTSEVTVNRVP